MLRTCVFVTGLLLASASELTEQADPEEDKAVGGGDWQKRDQLADCSLDGAEAVDGMLDGAIYIMAAVERCGGHGNQLDEVKCTVDVGASIAAVNEMINVVLKAVSKCGDFSSKHQECGMATGSLTRAAAQLTSASALIVAQCPNTHYKGAAPKGGEFDPHGYSTDLGMCVINVKNAMKELFMLISRFMTLKTNCADEIECAHNALKIVSNFAGIGAYISGALSRCSANKHNEDAACAEASLKLFRATGNVAAAAEKMDEVCKLTEDERLFLASEKKISAPTNSNASVTLGLVALLPITAVLSFVGGSRLAKARTVSSYDAESLVELSSSE